MKIQKQDWFALVGGLLVFLGGFFWGKGNFHKDLKHKAELKKKKR